jgi:hypothetical protein
VFDDGTHEVVQPPPRVTLTQLAAYARPQDVERGRRAALDCAGASL